jgi:hypothetical protein
MKLSEKRKLLPESKIWAEGLGEPILFKTYLEIKKSEKPSVQEVHEEELPPPIPMETDQNIQLPKLKTKKVHFHPKKMVFFLLISSVFFLLIQLNDRNKKIYIQRFTKMSMDQHQRILKDNVFEGWEKSLFFKEYLAQDYSQIWLVTSGYQNCVVEASFHSLKGKLLSLKDDEISFSSMGVLSNHVVELTSFDFTKGVRIIPGIYELDIRATHCKWDGLKPWMMNMFTQPEKDHVARIQVILFPDGHEKFHQQLENLSKKKLLIKKNEQKLHEAFWQDLAQKFQTLEAVSFQIEQHFLDFLALQPKLMKSKLGPMINEYSKKFGSFLTSFLVENEKSFKSSSSVEPSEVRNYDEIIRLTAKSIGLESMKFIEELQGISDFSSEKKLMGLSGKVKNKFSKIKREINQKLILISQDQENSQHNE